MKGKATSASGNEGKRDSDVADGIGNTNGIRRKQSEIGIRKGRGRKSRNTRDDYA